MHKITENAETISKKAIHITEASLNAFEGRKTHNEILTDLLKQIKPVNFIDYLGIDVENEKFLQKHIVVGVVKRLLEIASEKRWNLAKVYDFIYVYNSEYWKQFDREEIKKFLGDVALQMNLKEHEVRHYEFKEKLLKQFLTDSHLPSPKQKEDKILINLQNGTFEFTAEGKSQLREFRADDFITYQLPFTYDANATAPLFQNYLDKVLPDASAQKVLQEYTGYIFTKLNLEKMLMLYGSGANGKSVFFNVLKALIGEKNVLNYSMGAFNEEHNRAKLTDVLVNYSSEKGTDLNVDTFKALISGEPIQARLKYGNSFTLYNKVRFIVNANELPKETEHTEAYFRRFLIIPFNVTIPDFERDISLADKIIAKELAGVFNWVLEGLDRIIAQQKFTECKLSEDALTDFRRKSDSVALFI